mmetsp:Transcript_89051/g.229772  ORF Transcript_89051/g.229772 Transcript_89051/m.229772 type:complete len:225 (+) Transcript_89051:496-1170(+)
MNWETPLLGGALKRPTVAPSGPAGRPAGRLSRPTRRPRDGCCRRCLLAAALPLLLLDCGGGRVHSRRGILLRRPRGGCHFRSLLAGLHLRLRNCLGAGCGGQRRLRVGGRRRGRRARDRRIRRRHGLRCLLLGLHRRRGGLCHRLLRGLGGRRLDGCGLHCGGLRSGLGLLLDVGALQEGVLGLRLGSRLGSLGGLVLRAAHGRWGGWSLASAARGSAMQSGAF